MDMNGISTHAGAGKDGDIPCLTQFVRILLVDHDTSSLMSLASQFEEQFYKVTTTESAKIALTLFQERINYYDIVIADICMPEMGISEFVEKLHGQRMTIPIILIAEEITKYLVREAIGYGVCYVFSKPPSHHDISNVWQHIPRVTGKMPALSDMTNYIDMEKDGSSDAAVGNQDRNYLNTKLDNTDRERVKRKKNQNAENPNSSNDAHEEDGHNTKKPRLTWTSYLDDKFLQAINIIGERGARPKRILRLMNEPGLTPRHIASHLQKYRRQGRQSLNLQKIGSPDMPDVLPAATLNNVAQGQTFGTTSSASVAAPNFVHYSVYGVKQDQDALNYSDNNNVDAIINDGVQVLKGNGGGSNSLMAPNQEPEAASGRLSNGLEALNQEPTGKFGTVMFGFGNASNMGNMKIDNLGEGTSGSDQQFDGMPINDDINQIMQDLENSEVDIWDWFN